MNDFKNFRTNPKAWRTSTPISKKIVDDSLPSFEQLSCISKCKRSKIRQKVYPHTNVKRFGKNKFHEITNDENNCVKFPFKSSYFSNCNSKEKVSEKSIDSFLKHLSFKSNQEEYPEDFNSGENVVKHLNLTYEIKENSLISVQDVKKQNSKNGESQNGNKSIKNESTSNEVFGENNFESMQNKLMKSMSTDLNHPENVHFRKIYSTILDKSEIRFPSKISKNVPAQRPHNRNKLMKLIDVSRTQNVVNSLDEALFIGNNSLKEINANCILFTRDSGKPNVKTRHILQNHQTEGKKENNSNINKISHSNVVLNNNQKKAYNSNEVKSVKSYNNIRGSQSLLNKDVKTKSLKNSQNKRTSKKNHAAFIGDENPIMIIENTEVKSKKYKQNKEEGPKKLPVKIPSTNARKDNLKKNAAKESAILFSKEEQLNLLSEFKCAWENRKKTLTTKSKALDQTEKETSNKTKSFLTQKTINRSHSRMTLSDISANIPNSFDTDPSKSLAINKRKVRTNSKKNWQKSTKFGSKSNQANRQKPIRSNNNEDQENVCNLKSTHNSLLKAKPRQIDFKIPSISIKKNLNKRKEFKIEDKSSSSSDHPNKDVDEIPHDITFTCQYTSTPFNSPITENCGARPMLDDLSPISEEKSAKRITETFIEPTMLHTTYTFGKRNTSKNTAKEDKLWFSTFGYNSETEYYSCFSEYKSISSNSEEESTLHKSSFFESPLKRSPDFNALDTEIRRERAKDIKTKVFPKVNDVRNAKRTVRRKKINLLGDKNEKDKLTETSEHFEEISNWELCLKNVSKC